MIYINMRRTFYCRWMQSVDSSPGFNMQVLDLLRRKSEADPVNYGSCSIMMDGMSLKKVN